MGEGVCVINVIQVQSALQGMWPDCSNPPQGGLHYSQTIPRSLYTLALALLHIGFYSLYVSVCVFI